MKILYHHRTQAEDGQAVHIRSLVRAFEGLGAEVREVALVEKTGDSDPAKGDPAKGDPAKGDPAKGDPAKGDPAKVTPAKTSEAEESARSFPWSLVSHVPRFVREIAEYGYSVPAARRLRRAAAELRPDFIYERYAFGNRAGVKVARELGIPLILEVNSPMVHELGRTRGLSFPGYARRVETEIFRGADRIAVVTQVLGDMLVEMGVEPERIFVTPNGVHPDHFEGLDRVAARRDLGIEDTTGTILGFTGYYRDWHRLDLVIEGLARDEALSGAHLVLVGKGPVEQELRACAAKHGVASRVHFAGTRPHHRIPQILAAFDVGLVPAINPYASPLKLHEYMAAGVVPVAPDQPNLREVLTDGQDALLFPPGDGVALNLALGRLASNDDLRATLGAAAAATVERDDLTWDGNAKRVLEVVRSLAEGSRSTVESVNP